jgi:GNAT superfamily N-acetyltransferase
MKIAMTERFKFISPKDSENYREQAGQIADAAWPEFMLNDPVAGEYWGNLFSRFEEYQFALWDNEQNRMAVMANSLPFYWDRPLEELTEGGWDWVFGKAVEDHENGITPNIQSAIQIAIHPDYQGYKLSAKMVLKMREIGQSKGFQSLVAPVRPSQFASRSAVENNPRRNVVGRTRVAPLLHLPRPGRGGASEGHHRGLARHSR